MSNKRFVLFAIGGFFLSIFLYNAYDAGYFERWEKMTNVSQEVIGYFSITDHELENPSCDYSSPEFSFISNSPRNIVDCAQNIMRYAEGNYRDVYVLDNEGNYWIWSHMSDMNLIALFCVSIFGSLVGIVIGVITAKPDQKDESQSD